MTKQKFELEWDEEYLGREWINTGNFEVVRLYSKGHTRRGVVIIREITKTFNPLKLLSRLRRMK